MPDGSPSLAALLYLLAWDTTRLRLTGASRLAHLVRAGALTELAQRGLLVDVDGVATPADPDARTGDPVLDGLLELVEESRPRRWKTWVTLRAGVTLDAVRALHTPSCPFVLPNAWDVPSTRLVEEAGAAAVATTSTGLARELGAADGDRLSRDDALAAVARITLAVDAPVGADIETGYADDPAGIGDTIRAVLAAGALGVNIEDGLYGGDARLRPVAEQAERIAAAREAADAAGVPLFFNARVDTYLRGAGDMVDTLERAAAFLAAGAEGVFVPGAVDPAAVKALPRASRVR